MIWVFEVGSGEGSVSMIRELQQNIEKGKSMVDSSEVKTSNHATQLETSNHETPFLVMKFVSCENKLSGKTIFLEQQKR